MRTIKFRAWEGRVEGFTYFGLSEVPEWVKYADATLIQEFTGLLSKTGQEIYEGDILATTFSRTTKLKKKRTVHNHLIEWNKRRGQWFGQNMSLWKLTAASEVVGNRFETANLLSQEKLPTPPKEV